MYGQVGYASAHLFIYTRPLGICAFCKRSGNGERLKGNVNSIPFPFNPYPLPDKCQEVYCPDDLSILVFLPKQQPVLLQGEDFLPVLPEIELALTVNQVFG
ncbi:hypothetical protein NSTC731_04422 [Nostoc sp. DSM 114167]|jgi:hypothetical protein